MFAKNGTLHYTTYTYILVWENPLVNGTQFVVQNMRRRQFAIGGWASFASVYTDAKTTVCSKDLRINTIEPFTVRRGSEDAFALILSWFLCNSFS